MGKKVFFLYPSALVQNQIIAELVQEEFEVYVVKDEARLRQLLKKYPDSVVFASINEGIREDAWEEWIKGVMADNETSGVDIGIISSGMDENLRTKYFSQFNIRCGYTVLQADLGPVIKQLVDVLYSVNAKGRRKYIRAVTDQDTNTTVNLPMNGTFINGLIRDISVVGFSCTFAEDPELKRNVLFTDVQIRLQSQLLKVEGIVFGSRIEGDEKTYVLLITQRTPLDVRNRIRKYIQSNLQSRMDDELKGIPRN